MRETARTGRGHPDTVGDLLSELTEELGSREEPAREASELLAAMLDVPRHWPTLHAHESVDDGVRARARAAAARRAAGAPLAYAVGRANFRRLTLSVDERVLIPRPETEVLVDLVLARCRSGVIADVGTGSGAIAIALAVEGQFDVVFATDISGDALEVAQANAVRYALRGESLFVFPKGDLLSPLERYDVPLAAVVSNPPYISYEEAAHLPASVRDWEPSTALYSPDNGLAVTKRLVTQAADRLMGGGLLALEVDARRASLVAEFVAADARYENISVHLDLAGCERFVLATCQEHT